MIEFKFEFAALVLRESGFFPFFMLGYFSLRGVLFYLFLLKYSKSNPQVQRPCIFF